ncbi:aminotransferase class V-fold PLP-dependent enzyme [Maritalea mediterranea]|uniref:Aminotransferase class V-fold PLP-dependent enzyme n=1 Tax=Maritalea mediterranea TaxID=2909667 RepID=A0ABS9EB97_9HYPH|nr:aminotransferase class V-fold PLP-dependent enzyme [Maritalea mediterranea]MCF4099030.1 aminotransferase class V-fold PLP-dependent enzyme [Maritalea mediterranea]
MTLPFNPATFRAHFPAFNEDSLKGWGFFENAGGSYMCKQVIDRYNHYFTAHKLQPYGQYPASKEAGVEMDEGHVALARLLNVDVSWIHFGPSTSANTYTLAHAFGQMLKAGDAIIVTNQDHEANTGAVRRMAEEKGLEVREWKVNSTTGSLEMDAFENLLDNKVKLITFPHASNIVGEINPVAEICAAAKKVGAKTIVDGVAYAPHTMPDLSALGADVYLFSTYKTFGPHQGLMAINPSLAGQLPNQGHFFNNGIPRKRLVPAGPDHAQIAASAGIAAYFDQIADEMNIARPNNGERKLFSALREQETALLTPLMDYLKSSNKVRLVGTDDLDARVPTISMICEKPGLELARDLAEHKIMAAGGHFYVYRLMEGMEIDPNHGVLRTSFVHFTDEAEVQQLISALDQVL